MRSDFIDNCKTILRQAWDLFFGGGRQFINLDSIYNRSDKFTAFVVPMAAMAGLCRFVSLLFWRGNFEAAIVGMIYNLAAFMGVYLILALFSEWLVRRMTEIGSYVNGRGSVLAIQLMLLHFDVSLLFDVWPSFGFLSLIYLYSFYLILSLSDSYLGIHDKPRIWFTVITSAAFFVSVKAVDWVLNQLIPNSPL